MCVASDSELLDKSISDVWELSQSQCVSLRGDSSAAVLIRLPTKRNLNAAVFTHINAAHMHFNLYSGNVNFYIYIFF